MDQNDTKLYKLTLSLGKATIILTSSTVTIHHCPVGKFNQRNPVTAPHSLAGRSVELRGGFAEKEEKIDGQRDGNVTFIYPFFWLMPVTH